MKATLKINDKEFEVEITSINESAEVSQEAFEKLAKRGGCGCDHYPCEHIKKNKRWRAEEELYKLLAIQRVKDYIIENELEYGFYIIGFSDIRLQFAAYDIGFRSNINTIIPQLTDKHAKQVIDNCESDLKIIFDIK